MRDDDYNRLLKALAAKLLVARGTRTDADYLLQVTKRLRSDLEEVSALARLTKVVQDRPNDQYLEGTLREELLQSSPIEKTRQAFEEAGILDIFDEAGSVLIEELRREAIPPEDFQFLREAGYTEDEIEILLAVAIHNAHTLRVSSENVSRQLRDAAAEFNDAVARLGHIPVTEPVVKKRKIFNGIGKVLGGCIAGLGNTLMATGTILAPNPATAAGAIASAAVAVPAIMSGVGDLRGE